jgi:MoaA/NifB/PqqE/SkfB family radical SAM enzyme
MTSRAATVYKTLYDGVNHGLRTFAGGRFAALCRPAWISFLLTERCNSRCVHCDIWHNKGKEDPPTVDQLKAALSDLRGWLGPAHVCLTGGEALLRPYATDLVAHGSRIGLMMELLTHGWWKDQSRIEELARARPWRVTLSFDGIGEIHDRVRGREGFFERTAASIETLKRMRQEEGLDYSIRLKTVVMSHNLHGLEDVARFATQPGMDVLFQPVEQNYDQAEDERWFEKSDNWPSDAEEAVAAVRNLIDLKRQGLSIANSETQLDEMIPYFRDPYGWEHRWAKVGPEGRRRSCGALGLFQVQADGDVTVCYKSSPIGNIKVDRPRDIWRRRPHLWESGCCREPKALELQAEQRGSGKAGGVAAGGASS